MWNWINHFLSHENFCFFNKVPVITLHYPVVVRLNNTLHVTLKLRLQAIESRHSLNLV